jgi:ubiquinone/menaquinone biosynthesis C-methylase UbiE
MHSDLGRVQRVYRRLATSYDRSAARWDRLIGLDAGRRWIAERAHGRVLEVGIGTGLSLPHYPQTVEVVGIDATAAMLDIARRRAGQLRRPVELHVGDAEALSFPDAHFDTVAFTYSLCTIPAPARALREARRVMRPGGSLVIAEHVRSPNVIVRGAQRVLNPLFERLEADHLLREPLVEVRALGFAVDEVERAVLGIVERLRATKPSGR